MKETLDLGFYETRAVPKQGIGAAKGHEKAPHLKRMRCPPVYWGLIPAFLGTL
jgi:hypothetical protein